MERFLFVAMRFLIIYIFLDIFTTFRKFATVRSLYFGELFRLVKIINMPKNFTCWEGLHWQHVWSGSGWQVIFESCKSSRKVNGEKCWKMRFYRTSDVNYKNKYLFWSEKFWNSKHTYYLKCIFWILLWIFVLNKYSEFGFELIIEWAH